MQVRARHSSICSWLMLGVLMAWSHVAAAQQPPMLRLLGASNRALDAERDALGISHAVTNNGTLPREVKRDTISQDPSDIRLEVEDPQANENEIWAWLESLDPTSGEQRSALRLALRRARAGESFRSGFIRLVGDEVDLHAPGVEAQTLLVSLRGVVRARYEAPAGNVQTELRVGRPGSETGASAARRARLVVHVLRSEGGGAPVIGHDAQDTLRIVHAQLRTANSVWLQCALTFGDPAETPIEIVDPPAPALLAISDGDGLPAQGAGSVRFLADGRAIGPIMTLAAATPLATAQSIARALREDGFSVDVSENPKARFGAGNSADLLVRRRDGTLVTLTADPTAPLSTDARQHIEIGAVDLLDGLREFDNMVAQAGTLEERTLVKALSDDDPATIDLFVVNRFTEATRQGEAFIANTHGAIVNTVILDRQGLRHLPLAWTIAHEVGHVLMDDPLHPDNVGPDRPWLLMDADNSRGTVNGPKRLRAQDCARVRSVAGRAQVPLLSPYTLYDTPTLLGAKGASK